jgi:hypothetical protein
MKHASNRPQPETKIGKMLRLVVFDALSADEALLFDKVFADSPTLETEIALARTKLYRLERDYAEGRIKDQPYRKQWASQMDSLRKLVATNQKARIAEETLRKLNSDPSALPDAYDPLAEPEGSDESEAEGESE